MPSLAHSRSDAAHADDGARVCLDCGYLLRGLTAGACPECGRVFDPNDPETYVNTTHQTPLWLGAAVGVVSGIGCTVLLWVTQVFAGIHAPMAMIIVLGLLAVGYGGFWSLVAKPGWRWNPSTHGLVAGVAFFVGEMLPIATIIALLIASGFRP